jgi:hypothetical protein
MHGFLSLGYHLSLIQAAPTAAAPHASQLLATLIGKMD